MSREKTSDNQRVSSLEIWVGLTPEQRRPVIHLLVQIALEVFQSDRVAEDDRDLSHNATPGGEESREIIDRLD